MNFKSRICTLMIFLALFQCRVRDEVSNLAEGPTEEAAAASGFEMTHKIAAENLQKDLEEIAALMKADNRFWSADVLMQAWSNNVQFTRIRDRASQKLVACIAWNVNTAAADPKTQEIRPFIEIEDFSIDPYLQVAQNDQLLRYLKENIQQIRTEDVNKRADQLPIFFTSLYAYKSRVKNLKAIGFQIIDRIGETILPTMERSGDVTGINYAAEGILALGLKLSTRESTLNAYGARSELSISLTENLNLGTDPVSLAVVSEFTTNIRIEAVRRPELNDDTTVIQRAADKTAFVVRIFEGGIKSLPVIGPKGEGKSYFVENFTYALARGQLDRRIPKIAAMHNRLGDDYLLLEMNGNALRANTEFRGQEEKRLEALKALSAKGRRKVIIVIDEAHNVPKEIAEELKAYQAKGWIQLVLISTWAEYEKSVWITNEPLQDRGLILEFDSYTKEEIIDIIADDHRRRLARNDAIDTTLDPKVLAETIVRMSELLSPSSGRVRGPKTTLYPLLKTESIDKPLNTVREVEEMSLQLFRINPKAFFPSPNVDSADWTQDMQKRVVQNLSGDVGEQAANKIYKALRLSLRTTTPNNNLLVLRSADGKELPIVVDGIAESLGRPMYVFNTKAAVGNFASFQKFMHDIMTKDALKGASLSVIYLRNLSDIPAATQTQFLDAVSAREIQYTNVEGDVHLKRFPGVLFITSDKSGEAQTISDADFFNDVELDASELKAPESSAFAKALAVVNTRNPQFTKAFNEGQLKEIAATLSEKQLSARPEIAAAFLQDAMVDYAMEKKIILNACEAAVMKAPEGPATDSPDNQP